MRTRSIILSSLVLPFVIVPQLPMSPNLSKPSRCAAYDRATTAFEHASVITMTDTVPHPDYTVIVKDGRIAWVGPSSKASVPSSARKIDASGKFIVPGLADMHVHMETSDTLLYLAYGVTQVREMNGTTGLLTLRDNVCHGSTLGPSMSVSGPLLAGVKQRWRHVLVETPDSGTRLVASEAADGYDAIKVYDGLTKETYGAIVKKASEVGIPVVGHIPKAVGLDGVLAAHQKSLEHGDQVLNAAVGHDGDSAQLAAATRRIASAGSWVTPTLAVERVLASTGTKAYDAAAHRPEVQYMDDGTRGWWLSLSKPRGGADLSSDDFPSKKSAEYFGYKQELIRELYRAGVRLLVGTDTPNPLMIPGYSLHDEIASWQQAGLPTGYVLTAATRGAAEFLGQEKEFGTIRVGTRADLLLVSANPLKDSETLRNPDGVMVRGKFLTRDILDVYRKSSMKK